MGVLRLEQSVLGDGRYRVGVAFEDGAVRRSAVRDFAFALTDADREDVRWYLEDFLEYPLDPAPRIAARIEQRMAEIGRELFAAIFTGTDAAGIWLRVRDRLDEVRVEVAADVDGAAILPWELLVDPDTALPVALQAASFVHVNYSSPTTPRLPEPAGQLRVLLVVCRPGGRVDVPFRSVARQLVGLGDRTPGVLDVDVLRPPTFKRLTEVLEAAQRAGRPYHVVHFDGHGVHVDPDALGDEPVPGLSDTTYRVIQPVAPGTHGFLLFEEPDSPGNQTLVGGAAIGALLARTGVPVLLLNACRSAYAETPPAPVDAAADPHRRVQAYGSLALEVTEQGVAGVVAMRYNVYVVTAAQFVADLYTALLSGQPLGEAVSAGRRRLAASPDRQIAFKPLPLQDWSVPVVYEAAPAPILAPPTASGPRIVIPSSAAVSPGAAADGLPRRPDVGFFGRDETLLALDRAFDRHRIVLLHAYAGSGKTSTAVEFARWYAGTGGLDDGPVVFSSLEHYTPLARLLNDWAVAFAPQLAAGAVEWETVNDQAIRRSIALQVMAQVPMLWIWDNVEPVAGFPAGTPSAWTAQEQAELADFLRDVAGTKARVLLTSRRGEHDWLCLIPARVALPPMPMREMVQLAGALAERHSHRITDWRPLLRYTAGNPLTITVVVGQVLREGLTGKTQLEAFVEQLRVGEAGLTDDEAEGRTRSLGASLSYGFATAFTDAERAQLSVLHLFQDTVDVDALVHMGAASEPVPALAGLTREAGTALLDRAADLGLLARSSDGRHQIHPALPWYFRDLAATHHTDTAAVTGAYTSAIAELGRYYWRWNERGHTGIIPLLRPEEANLLHARALARTAGRWQDVIGCMQGLYTLYQRLGRYAEWARLVAELTPDLAGPADGPLPGREDAWSLHTHYRADVAVRARDWATAARLQHTRLAYDRERVADSLELPADQLTEQQRRRVRNLAASEHAIGDILRQQSDPAAVDHYQRALDLQRHINDRTGEAIAAFNLGHTYLKVPQLRDLDQAEHWYRFALDRFEPYDQLGRAQATSQLGDVAYLRYQDAVERGEPDESLQAILATAERHYAAGLAMMPADAATDLAVAHEALGNVYADTGQPDTALRHYQQAIREHESSGNRHAAGRTRRNVAITLADHGRTTAALDYARAALADFTSYGPSAADDVTSVQRLIADLEES